MIGRLNSTIMAQYHSVSGLKLQKLLKHYFWGIQLSLLLDFPKQANKIRKENSQKHKEVYTEKGRAWFT